MTTRDTQIAEETQRVVQAQMGDAEAFAVLVARHQGTVLRFMRRIAGNAEDARDLTQEAFLQAYLHLPTLRDVYKFGPWLRSIAYTTALQWRRRQHRERTEHLDEEGEPCPVPEPSPLSLLLRDDMRDALDRLSPEQYAVVVLHYFDGCDYGEIAAQLGLPVSTVRGRLHQARRRLRKEMLAMMPLDTRVEMMERTPFADEPDAHAFFDRMLQTIQNADSLIIESEHSWECKGKEIDHSTYSLLMKKPGFARLDTFQDGDPKGVLIGDGTCFWTHWPGGKPWYGFEEMEAYKKIRMTSYMKDETPADRYSLWHQAGKIGTRMILQPSIFFGYDDPMMPYLDGVRHVTTEPVDGEACDVIEASFMGGQRSRFLWLSRRDALPRRLHEVVRLDDPILSHERWTRVELNPALPDDLFRWSPPEGWTQWGLPPIDEGLLKPGTPAQDFRCATLAGEPLRLSDLRGSAVWLVFWRVGCQPCREEIPRLEAMHRKYADHGLVVLGFNCADDREIVTNFFRENPVTFPNIVDPSEAATKVFFHEYQKLAGMSAVPCNYLIDREGRVVRGWYDYKENDEELNQALEGLGIQIDK